MPQKRKRVDIVHDDEESKINLIPLEILLQILVCVSVNNPGPPWRWALTCKWWYYGVWKNQLFRTMLPYSVQTDCFYHAWRRQWHDLVKVSMENHITSKSVESFLVSACRFAEKTALETLLSNQFIIDRLPSYHSLPLDDMLIGISSSIATSDQRQSKLDVIMTYIPRIFYNSGIDRVYYEIYMEGNVQFARAIVKMKSRYFYTLQDADKLFQMIVRCCDCESAKCILDSCWALLTPECVGKAIGNASSRGFTNILEIILSARIQKPELSTFNGIQSTLETKHDEAFDMVFDAYTKCVGTRGISVKLIETAASKSNIHGLSRIYSTLIPSDTNGKTWYSILQKITWALQGCVENNKISFVTWILSKIVEIPWDSIDNACKDLIKRRIESSYDIGFKKNRFMILPILQDFYKNKFQADLTTRTSVSTLQSQMDLLINRPHLCPSMIKLILNQLNNKIFTTSKFPIEVMEWAKIRYLHDLLVIHMSGNKFGTVDSWKYDPTDLAGYSYMRECINQLANIQWNVIKECRFLHINETESREICCESGDLFIVKNKTTDNFYDSSEVTSVMDIPPFGEMDDLLADLINITSGIHTEIEQSICRGALSTRIVDIRKNKNEVMKNVFKKSPTEIIDYVKKIYRVTESESNQCQDYVRKQISMYSRRNKKARTNCIFD